MCGILGVLNFNGRPVNEGLVLRMRDTMYHRGPNDAGLFVEGPLALGHRRLSIIDLSEKGHQPMTNEDGSLVLVCNGEIYNYVELREELEKKGHGFRSTSDSEVILHQYEEDGEGCLEKFNGMFALLIWDSRRKRLFAARDRVGIKPLYYYIDNNRIIFASEIKAVLEDPSVPARHDPEGVSDYFFAGRALAGKTLFDGIKEVEPGHMVTVGTTGKDLRINKYWDVSFEYNYSRKIEVVKEEIFSLLDDAVRIHCRSDAPLGCHLSGGLDSSTIVALTSRYRDNLKVFSIKFSDQSFIDETPYAKAVAEHAGAEYIEGRPLDRDVEQLLPFLIWKMDLPMISEGVLGYYYVNHLAHNYVKVTMTGHGGDEVFAGYPSQFQVSYNTTEMFKLHEDPVRTAQYSLVKRFLRGIALKGPQGIYSSIVNRLSMREPTMEDIWVQLHCAQSTDNNYTFHRDLRKSLDGYSPREDYLRPLREVQTDKTLDKCLYHDLRVYLPSLLHLEDRASMAVSLESRLPLLDYRIIEFMATVPPEQKVMGMQPKYLLRELASTLIPEEVWRRKDKRPFPVPAGLWSSEKMIEYKKRILLSPQSIERGILTPNALKVACHDVDAWNILNMELWFKIFIDKDPEWVSLARS